MIITGDNMLQVDSRNVKKGDTFLALRGVSSDGHHYISKAIENGASKIIAEEGNYSVLTEIVPDTREYLAQYLKQEYQTMINDITLIGITGTNGKTTTAYLLYQALNKLGEKTAYIGTIGFYLEDKVRSLNNTTPDLFDLYELFKESYDKGFKTIVMEVSSQAISYGRIKEIPFSYTLFTNLTQDHLDYHKTMENYANAKQQLFKQLKKDGWAIINADDSYKERFTLKENNNAFYGFTNGDLQIQKYYMTMEETTFFYLYEKNEYQVSTSLTGKYNLYNLGLMILTLIKMNYPIENINKIVKFLSSPSGRMEKIPYKKNSIIIDYAHTPDAICKLIRTVKEILKGNLYVVFGCTGDRDRIKRPIMTNLVLTNCTKAILTNDDPHFENPKQIFQDMLKENTLTNYEICEDRKVAIQKGIDLLKENDILLILGKGHEEFMIIGNEKIPFHDKTEVFTILNKIQSSQK